MVSLFYNKSVPLARGGRGALCRLLVSLSVCFGAVCPGLTLVGTLAPSGPNSYNSTLSAASVTSSRRLNARRLVRGAIASRHIACPRTAGRPPTWSIDSAACRRRARAAIIGFLASISACISTICAYTRPSGPCARA
ncbi:hypothetical protein C8Q79DRAFT_305849 [Trametes meyenii]|nr:hypothetical protein C8Q79DRAFT_305849 [Trametes meyenii]